MRLLTDESWFAENHWSGRAASVAQAKALGRPSRSVPVFGVT